MQACWSTRLLARIVQMVAAAQRSRAPIQRLADQVAAQRGADPVIALAEGALVVSVLDPVADRHLLGTRYCTAGFVFQVQDADRGPLLAGPTYPHAYDVVGGQGAPDAFQPHLPVERAGDGTPSRVLGIGTSTRLTWRPRRRASSIAYFVATDFPSHMATT